MHPHPPQKPPQRLPTSPQRPPKPADTLERGRLHHTGHARPPVVHVKGGQRAEGPEAARALPRQQQTRVHEQRERALAKLGEHLGHVAEPTAGWVLPATQAHRLIEHKHYLKAHRNDVAMVSKVF